MMKNVADLCSCKLMNYVKTSFKEKTILNDYTFKAEQEEVIKAIIINEY